MRQAWAGGAAIAVGLAGAVTAQQPDAGVTWTRPGAPRPAEQPAVELVRAEQQPTEPPPVGKVPVIPDPTQPSGKLKDALMPPRSPAPTAPSPVARLPALALRGRVLAAGRPGAALLEVEGRVYSVSPGQTVAAGGTVLRVVEVSAGEVRLELLPGRDVMVLN